MITTRAEYDYVTIDDGLVINGGIMPSRDATGAGIDAPDVKRAEDVAFCLEAAHERARTAGTTRPTVTTVDKYIIGARWQSAISALHECASKACTAGTNAPYMQTIPAELPANVPLHYIYSRLYFDPSSLVADANMFQSGEPYRAEKIRDVYRDIMRLTMFEHNGTFSRSSDEYTETRGGSGEVTAAARGAVVFSYVAVRWPDDSFLVDDSGWAQAIANIGRFQFHPSGVAADHIGRYQLVVELQIVLTTSKIVIDADSTTPVTTPTETHTYHYIWVQPETGNALDCAQANIGGIARTMAQSFHGGALPTHTTLPSGTEFVATVTVKSVRAAVYLDDHTDFSGIPFDLD